MNEIPFGSRDLLRLLAIGLFSAPGCFARSVAARLNNTLGKRGTGLPAQALSFRLKVVAIGNNY
jgi:hypothetical protein